MRRFPLGISYFFIFILFVTGCATPRYSYREPTYEKRIEAWTVLREFSLEPELERKILDLNPEHITGQDITNVLSKAPAPRIINVHGGIYPVHLAMESFSYFLIAMGYPEGKVRHPENGSYSYSCYESSRKLAGLIAWYYEKEGMKPMLIGHSQGGIQTVKILHQLAGNMSDTIPVWNPLLDSAEERDAIIDPITGKEVPVVGVKVSYATAVGAGGFTRFLPNQWAMTGRLRTIPDSAEHFTGFYIGLDLLGGDFLGFGPGNKYEPNGTAEVRNVRLPTSYSHVTVPTTRHLAESHEIRDWINSYTPSEEPEVDTEFESSSTNILWAADVWQGIKKHWVLELQRLIRAKNSMGIQQSAS
ncbi:hypothetical protein EP227_05405 [bacterium]|nr:MAG: hypothetical protein EP227_05405 [bacterium]